MDDLLEEVADAETGVDPEDLLFGLEQVGGQGLPVLVSGVELLAGDGRPAAAEFERGVDGHNQGRLELHILDVLELLLVLGVALDHRSLHFAVLLGDAFFEQLLDQEVVDEFVVEVLVLDFPAVDGVLPDFLGDEEAGGDVDEVVVFCDLFAEGGPAAVRCAHDDDLGGGPGRGLYGLDREGFLRKTRGTFSYWMMKCSSLFCDRSISQYFL